MFAGFWVLKGGTTHLFRFSPGPFGTFMLWFSGFGVVMFTALASWALNGKPPE
jgi:hypothetical protein